MAWRIVTHEGPLGFYRGFLPAYARIGPTILIQLPVAEALLKQYAEAGAEEALSPGEGTRVV